MVRDVAPVGDVEQQEVGVESGREAAFAAGTPQDVRGIHRAGGERLGMTVLYAAVFVPMFFLVDRFAYRAYRRRVGDG